MSEPAHQPSQPAGQPEPKGRPKGGGISLGIPNPFAHVWGAVKGAVGGAIAGVIGPFRDAWIDAQLIVMGSPETRVGSVVHLCIDVLRMSLLTVEVPVNIAHGVWHGFVHPESALNPPNIISRILHREMDNHPSHDPVRRAADAPAFKPKEVTLKHKEPPKTKAADSHPAPPTGKNDTKAPILEKKHVTQLQSAVQKELYDDSQLLKNDPQYREWKRWMSENRSDYAAKFEQMTVKDRLRCIQKAEAADMDRAMLLHATGFTESTEKQYAERAGKQFDAWLNEGVRETQKQEEALAPLRKIGNDVRPEEVLSAIRDAARNHPALSDALQDVVTRPEIVGILAPFVPDAPKGDAPGHGGAIDQVWDRILQDPPPRNEPPSNYPGGSHYPEGPMVRPEEVPGIADAIREMPNNPDEGLRRIVEQYPAAAHEEDRFPGPGRDEPRGGGYGGGYEPASPEQIERATNFIREAANNPERVSELVNNINEEFSRGATAMQPEH